MIIKASFSPMYSDFKNQYLINDCAQDMSHQIDNEILRDFLISDGWSICKNGSPLTPYGIQKIREWCKSNIKDSDWAYLDGFLLKNKEDLLMFKLRWA